jgi:hypothetical protein
VAAGTLQQALLETFSWDSLIPKIVINYQLSN